MAAMKKMTVDQLDVRGKRVLVRVDFNLPLDKNTGEITDDKRIKGALPTIQYLVEKGAKVILVSHLGRPTDGPDEKLSLKPVADRLAQLLGSSVQLANDVIGEDAKEKASALRDGEVLILENVRFHKEETKNDPAFAKELASLAELYVNDAFGTAHRAHASTAGVANYLPGAMGKLVEKEIAVMGGALNDAARPFVAIIGGAKVSDKINVVNNLLDKVDTLIVGGGMAYTFLKAQGREIGISLCEEDRLDLARDLLAKSKEKGVKLLLPVDHVVAKEYKITAEPMIVSEIPADTMGMDIGPETIKQFSAAIADAKTVLWNGPMGVFEFDNFAAGTRELARAIAASSATSIIGGGDSAAAVELLGFGDKVTHISTGGGASLEFLEGKVLPGIDCLVDAERRRVFAAGNWKMNQGVPAEAAAFLEQLIPEVADADSTIAVGVPFTALDAALSTTAYTNIKIAAENCHFEDSGAYTGEVSAKMLAYMGVPYCIIGHSERREYFAETDETVNKKAHALLEWGVRPIICCGESLAQREAGETFDFVKSQIVGAFKDIPLEKLYLITIAYEPIWAIGTGVTASDEQAEEACAFIRGVIADLYDEDAASAMRIQYGGSVNPKNVVGLFGQENIDGGLVGGASLKVADFGVICNAYQAK